jgi:hypothetical protein
MEERLLSMGIEVIKTLKHPRLYDAVSFHPDMVICPVGAGKMVVEPTMYELFQRKPCPATGPWCSKGRPNCHATIP